MNQDKQREGGHLRNAQANTFLKALGYGAQTLPAEDH